MIILYLIFIIIFIISTRYIKDINDCYLNKDTTKIINGFFVITIFFSHFRTYIQSNGILDDYLIKAMDLIGQLMVSTFLYYSGYGIYESIKKNKNYISNFFKNRIIPTFLNYSIAIIIFVIVNIVSNNFYDYKTIMLSFIGLESIGNSNWYMFSIFILYILTFLSFSNIFKMDNIYKIILLTIIITIYMFLISNIKKDYYANTLLCYPIGMIYSYHKNKIEKYVFMIFYYVLFILLILFCLFQFLIKLTSNIYIYNIYAILFVLIIVLISMKCEFRSKIYLFFGNHAFWIYILQKIPFMIFKSTINNNYVYFLLSFIITIAFSIFMKKLTDFMWKKLLIKKQNHYFGC